ncbi:glycosyltransferase family 2 protein [Mixta calida]|uniref:glycosyltransferase family 2 protein n=1 Tax=Mixta calida TaxID=665913 RepID=UPI0034D4A4CE
MFISVVSHGHSALIIELGTLKNLVSEHTVIVTDNIGEKPLKEFCSTYGIHYLLNEKRKGFGENNNQNYRYAVNKLSMTDDDYFLVLNPDVIVSNVDLIDAQAEMNKVNSQLATINLCKGQDIFDANVRNFPKIINFIESFLYKKNKTIINKAQVTDNCFVDWASGSFLIFKSALYKGLSGFDESFFMYCEDLDICRRAMSFYNQKVLYIASVRAFHIAAHNNRKIFSKHFIWHVMSVFRYCFIAKY